MSMHSVLVLALVLLALAGVQAQIRKAVEHPQEELPQDQADLAAQDEEAAKEACKHLDCSDPAALVSKQYGDLFSESEGAGQSHWG